MKSKKIRLTAIVFFLFTGIFILDAVSGSQPSTSLKIALVHFSVAYKQPDKNLAALKELHRKAARQGAKIILNTELALSGYSFSSRQDVLPFTREPTDKAVREMADLAKELNIFIGITFPEKDPETQSYYNCALVFSPQGRMICRYRKIYSEKRWARSGNPLQNGTFDTPWGRIGVAICADSYFGLIPRTLALRGTDLLWVPANWPPTGRLNPLDVWRTRAAENGIYLAACNRTGKDRVMDCTKAVSAVIASDGTVMKKMSSKESSLLIADIPLNNNGRIDHANRIKRMVLRDIGLYRQIYLDPWTENLTQYYKLPKTGKFYVNVIVPENGQMDIKAIEKWTKNQKQSRPGLWVLPRARPGLLDTNHLVSLAKTHNAAFALSFSGDETLNPPLLVTADGPQPFFKPDGTDPFPFRLCHFGPAVLALVPMEAFSHPELGVVLAKLGCDMVLLSEDRLSETDMLTCSVRTIDNIAVAASSLSSGLIAHMKDVHGDLKTDWIQKPGICSLELDTAETRKKKFYDRVDFDELLKIQTGEMK
ncbi:carbon-nitrogen hydrolase family protein [Desulfospira joergensenii]|uniref:carbon-nitrogen hydrolase family protein n=1 Tax=Desulfospira joergensenii TaxID=53329 RepID=UPI0003B3D5B7|nr:carbon-nitrogen hydrolase family protein [Desulfospira joergensenii]